MLRKSLLALPVLLLGALGFSAGDARAAAQAGIVLASADESAVVSRDAKARSYFTDLPVVTQDGETLRFYSDVLKDRIVVVSVFYTECTGMCPLIQQKLADLQDILGDRMGRDFFFVSVTLDPETDTPEVIKEYAEKFGAGDGWYFLTGDKKTLRTITGRLGQRGDDIARHTPYLMIGNVRTERWKKMIFGTDPRLVATYLEDLASEAQTLLED